MLLKCRHIHFREVAESVLLECSRLTACEVEVLPYHTLGEYKWKELGYEYPLAGIEPPVKERIRNANEILHTDKGTDSSR